MVATWTARQALGIATEEAAAAVRAVAAAPDRKAFARHSLQTPGLSAPKEAARTLRTVRQPVRLVQRQSVGVTQGTQANWTATGTG